jgi:glyoxylase-like metal-dependent hydrolase (beta-lactamase superfamily II)
MVPGIPEAITTVEPGQSVTLGGRDWKIVGGYGHCPEHACLYDAGRKVFISGDIVLPSISPNISLYPGGTGDPVGAYLQSLDDIEKQVPDDVMVLPSHGVPFTGLHKRLGELRQHHARRFERLREVLSPGPRTAFETMTGLFAHRALAPGDIFFALGETLSHLMHEVLRDRVTRMIKDGVALYSLA